MAVLKHTWNETESVEVKPNMKWRTLRHLVPLLLSDEDNSRASVGVKTGTYCCQAAVLLTRIRFTYKGFGWKPQILQINIGSQEDNTLHADYMGICLSKQGGQHSICSEYMRICQAFPLMSEYTCLFSVVGFATSNFGRNYAVWNHGVLQFTAVNVCTIIYRD